MYDCENVSADTFCNRGVQPILGPGRCYGQTGYFLFTDTLMLGFCRRVSQTPATPGYLSQPAQMPRLPHSGARAGVVARMPSCWLRPPSRCHRAGEDQVEQYWYYFKIVRPCHSCIVCIACNWSSMRVLEFGAAWPIPTNGSVSTMNSMAHRC